MTEPKKLAAHKNPDLMYKPGQSGNPAGRPKGARNKLSEAFIEALYQDFLVGGAAAVEAVRETDPSTYMRVVAGLLPRNVELTGKEGGAIQFQEVRRTIIDPLRLSNDP